jgi:hypothetical protein
MHARVRENKVGFVTFHVIIHENIQIERPGRIRIFARAPMAAFDFQQGSEQVPG